MVNADSAGSQGHAVVFKKWGQRKFEHVVFGPGTRLPGL